MTTTSWNDSGSASGRNWITNPIQSSRSRSLGHWNAADLAGDGHYPVEEFKLITVHQEERLEAILVFCRGEIMIFNRRNDWPALG